MNEVVPPVIPTVSIPQEASEFIGEGKKYKSIEEALKSVPNAQKHISQIEEDNAKLKLELEKRKAVEEVLAEIKSGVVPNETPQGNSIDAATIASIVSQQLQQSEQQKTAKTNTDSVVNAFSAKFGEKAETEYVRIAEESGLTVEALNKLSATSPKAVLVLAGLSGSTYTNAGKPSSTINSEALDKNNPPNELSAKVPKGATTKDLVGAWKKAGEIARSKIS